MDSLVGMPRCTRDPPCNHENCWYCEQWGARSIVSAGLRESIEIRRTPEYLAAEAFLGVFDAMPKRKARKR